MNAYNAAEAIAMHDVLRITTHVLPGSRVEVCDPRVREGDLVDIVLIPRRTETVRQSMLDLIKSLPAGPQSAPTWEDIERLFQEERNAWDR